MEHQHNPVSSIDVILNWKNLTFIDMKGVFES